MRKVVVTGIGIVSPLGVGVRTAWRRLLAGECGIVDLGEDYAELPSRVGGRVPRGNVENGGWNPEDWVEKSALRRMPLFAQYAMAASKQALDDANWHPSAESDLKRSGVAIGSGIGGFDAVYDASIAWSTGGYRKVSPMFVPSQLANMAAGHVSISTGFRGPNHTASTACTSGAHAVGDATNLIRLGMADTMLAGATEACVHPLAVAGFARARSLATKFNDMPSKASRPFDASRDGFVIGEGAAVLLLESEDHARERGARIYAEVAGYGMSGDAFHITAPHADGRGAEDCMRMALGQGDIEGTSVGYVNAHATSTTLGDAIESSAIARVAPNARVSSTKGATGHLLGGAGALEAAFTVLALSEQRLPPSLNLDEPGEGCTLDYVTTSVEAPTLDYALSNSFGFGGTNASLLFKRS